MNSRIHKCGMGEKIHQELRPYFCEGPCKVFINLLDRHPLNVMRRQAHYSPAPQFGQFLLYFEPTSLAFMYPEECYLDLETVQSAAPLFQVSEKCGLRVFKPLCYSDLDRHEISNFLLPVESDKQSINGF